MEWDFMQWHDKMQAYIYMYTSLYILNLYEYGINNVSIAVEY